MRNIAGARGVSPIEQRSEETRMLPMTVTEVSRRPEPVTRDPFLGGLPTDARAVAASLRSRG